MLNSFEVKPVVYSKFRRKKRTDFKMHSQSTQEDIVKLQILTLATKLYLTNPKQTRLLCQYVYNLAKYDTNYDIRDRARLTRALVFPSQGHEDNKLAKHAKKIFLATKPPPVQQSSFKGRHDDIFSVYLIYNFE